MFLLRHKIAPWFCIFLVFISAWSVRANAKDETEELTLCEFSPLEVEGFTKKSLPYSSDGQMLQFRVYDQKERLTSKNIHLIWERDLDYYQVTVFNKLYEPVFEVFDPLFNSYNCGGIGCQYPISNIPLKYMKDGPFYLKLVSITDRMGKFTRWSDPLGFIVCDQMEQIKWIE